MINADIDNHDLQNFRNCKKLEYLNLTSNIISTLEPLTECPLQTLVATQTLIDNKSIMHINKMPLEILDIRDTEIRDISLLNVPTLRLLRVSHLTIDKYVLEALTRCCVAHFVMDRCICSPEILSRLLKIKCLKKINFKNMKKLTLVKQLLEANEIHFV